MRMINETRFQENSWHPGMFEYIQTFGLLDATPVWVASPDAIFDALRYDSRHIATVVDPDLTPTRITVWRRIQVDGKEYICTVGIRMLDSLAEANVLISLPSLDKVYIALPANCSLELFYDYQRQIFLPILPLTEEPSSSGISAAMTRVEIDQHDVPF